MKTPYIAEAFANAVMPHQPSQTICGASPEQIEAMLADPSIPKGDPVETFRFLIENYGD